MKLTITKSEHMDDWYVIERAEHDGRSWLEPTGRNTMALRCSSRFSDADVEGTADEMRLIAEAIRSRGSFEARRCAVVVQDERVLFRSPRNSQTDGVCSLVEADELADEIDRVLGDAGT